MEQAVRSPIRDDDGSSAHPANHLAQLIVIRLGIFVMATLMVVQPLAAKHGQEDPRLEKLYGAFMSPCCWQQSLSVHESAVADRLRDQIRQMVHEGRSDEEIQLALVNHYTTRILALPEGVQRQWLFLTPWAALIAGLCFLSRTIRRMRISERDLADGPMAPAALMLDDEGFEG